MNSHCIATAFVVSAKQDLCFSLSLLHTHSSILSFALDLFEVLTLFRPCFAALHYFYLFSDVLKVARDQVLQVEDA